MPENILQASIKEFAANAADFARVADVLLIKLVATDTNLINSINIILLHPISTIIGFAN